MPEMPMDLSEAVRCVQRFERGDIGRRLASLENSFRGCTKQQSGELCETSEVA